MHPLVLYFLTIIIILISFQCFSMECGLSLCDPRIFPDLVSKCKDLEISTVYYQVPWNSIEPVIGEPKNWDYWDNFIKIIVGYEGYGWIWENGTYSYGKITGNKVIYVKGMDRIIKYIPQPQTDYTLKEGWNAIGYWGPELPINEIFPGMIVYHYKNRWNRYTPLEYLNNSIICQKANVYFVYKGKL